MAFVFGAPDYYRSLEADYHELQKERKAREKLLRNKAENNVRRVQEQHHKQMMILKSSTDLLINEILRKLDSVMKTTNNTTRQKLTKIYHYIKTENERMKRNYLSEMPDNMLNVIKKHLNNKRPFARINLQGQSQARLRSTSRRLRDAGRTNNVGFHKALRQYRDLSPASDLYAERRLDSRR